MTEDQIGEVLINSRAAVETPETVEITEILGLRALLVGEANPMSLKGENFRTLFL